MDDKEKEKKGTTYEMPDMAPWYIGEAEPKTPYGGTHIDPNKTYTFEEVQSWFTETKRYEMVDGKPYAMAGPRFKHQVISRNIFSQIDRQLDGRECRVFFETTIRKEPNRFRKDTFFIPDLVVLCDRQKVIDGWIVGAPDLVIEILSPSTKRIDRTLKREQYALLGVKEYWIVDIEAKIIEVNLLAEDGSYQMTPYELETVTSSFIEGLNVDFNQVFADSWID